MRLRQRGDTMIEVMVAFAVFAMAAVASVAIMNRGLAIAQRSLEITLVRQQIDSQAAMLRYARDNNSPAWQKVKSAAVDAGSASLFNVSATECPADGGAPELGNSFFIRDGGNQLEAVLFSEPNPDDFQSAKTYAQFDESAAYGLWVQPVEVAGTDATYDMYINACWDTVGGTVPQTVRTIVRLYDES